MEILNHVHSDFLLLQMLERCLAILILFMQPLMQFSFIVHHVSFDPVILQPLQTKSDLNWFNTTGSEPNQNIVFEVQYVAEGSGFFP